MSQYIIFSDIDGTIIKHNDGPQSLRSILLEDKAWIKRASKEEFSSSLAVAVFKAGKHCLKKQERR